ncbi:class I SAM-dependent methyltransferase [Rhizobium puerariae]|uniref:Class I SAM-dependent methyltransferase n=1 Tax=Rhizobium puerariae TaxID=1585791 RepID=A0ABV6AHE3_9HYPH
MSRLDIFISRMIAQRDILNHIQANDLLPAEGAVLEVGLGNGRSYSHLRELFPMRRIVAFDRHLGAHRTVLPGPEDFVMGEIRETATAFIGTGAALAHADIGTGYPEKDAIIVTWLPELLAGMLAHGGIAVSGLPLDHPHLHQLPRLPSVEEGRYYFYSRT